MRSERIASPRRRREKERPEAPAQSAPPVGGREDGTSKGSVRNRDYEPGVQTQATNRLRNFNETIGSGTAGRRAGRIAGHVVQSPRRGRPRGRRARPHCLQSTPVGHAGLAVPDPGPGRDRRAPERAGDARTHPGCGRGVRAHPRPGRGDPRPRADRGCRTGDDRRNTAARESRGGDRCRAVARGARPLGGPAGCPRPDPGGHVPAPGDARPPRWPGRRLLLAGPRRALRRVPYRGDRRARRARDVCP